MRASGLHTVIITNGHADIQRTKLKACKAVDLFDGIIVGGEEVLAGRKEKPHPSIFIAACKLAGCRLEEVKISKRLCNVNSNIAWDVGRLLHLCVGEDERHRPLYSSSKNP